MVDETMVRDWLVQIAARIRTNKLEITRLENEIAADMRRESALKALLTANDDTLGDSAQAQQFQDAGRISSDQQPAVVSVHPIEQASLDILREHGKPLHISNLRAELTRRGIPIPGKATDANVIVYLARSPHICRVGRGLYALRAWGVPEVPPRRRRRARKRRHSARRS